MSVTILVCPCGRRLKATGLAPGKSGRCPSCGALVRVPGTAPAPIDLPAGGEEDEWNWQGSYDLGQAVRPLALRPFESDSSPAPENRWPDDLDMPAAPERETPRAADADDEWGWHGTNYDLDAPLPRPVPSPAAAGETEADGPTPVPAPIGWTTKAGAGETKPQAPEPWCPPRLLYPVRGAEGISMAIIPGFAFWVMATLVPSYCLAIQADAEMLGTPLMGYLIALISALPTLMLMPMAVVYWLQYLGRVLTASFAGERLPPRPPDRNFDGLLDGLGSWLLWVVLGLGIGLLPLGAYWAAAEKTVPWNPALAAGLGLCGFPYAIMALLIIFLHDDPLEARPGVILGRIGRLLPSFLGLCMTTAPILGLTVGAFAFAFTLRSRSIWLFIAACLACWLLMTWTSIVMTYTLGSYYGAHRPQSRPARARVRARPGKPDSPPSRDQAASHFPD